MTISSALSNALSGLAATSRAIGVVSTNVANAASEGYGRREIELASRSDGVGGGVQVISVTRIMNQQVLTDRRAADGAAARAGTESGFLANAAAAIGEPGSGTSLGDLLTGFETALTSAAAQPDSEPRLQQAVDAAAALAAALGAASDAVQTERARADADIAAAVDQLNGDLTRIAELNGDICAATIAGSDAGSLVDERQRLIDRVSELVPVREVAREHGRVSLLAEGGLLLDGAPPVLGFQAATSVGAGSSLSGGSLSGITLNGQAVDMTRARSVLSGGRLDGLFAVRDDLAPQVQNDLDALARNLMERFEQTGVDPTLAPGSAGLFTDGGQAFATANEVGLSGRLSVNAAVDPDQGGALWRLRDGIGATAPGPVGDASGLIRLRGALTGLQSPASGSFGPTARDAATLAADLLSGIGVRRDRAELSVTQAGTRAEALQTVLDGDGVDTDAEMQKLLLIEQAYAANARVIATVQAMIDTLMRI